MRSSACGVACEVLDATEVERRFGIRLEPGERGLYQADGGIAYADRVLAGPRRRAPRSRGHSRVESIEETDAASSVGDVLARAAVVTVGPWAPALVRGRRDADTGDDVVLLRSRSRCRPSSTRSVAPTTATR